VTPDQRDRKRNATRVASRAESLTAEELDAGSDDPHAQAKALLDDSDRRADDRVSPPGKPVESGQSDDNVG
jgi:hypothetical protein